MIRRLAAAGLAVALAVAACGTDAERTPAERAVATTTAPAATDTPSTSTTTAPTTTTTPTTTSTTTPPEPLAWRGCSGGECATLAVPLDHASPEGPTIDLAIFRLPATGDRLGALFVNFGGPGAGAASFLRRFPIPSGVRRHFDVVAVDPRGVGDSTPLECGLDALTLHGVDPTVEDQADADALVSVAQRFADDCGRAAAGYLPHLGSWTVARDFDAVRAAMGDEQLNYLGFSYGTVIGQAYAELFPERVRTMVLDGVVDPALSGVDAAAKQARGFERALANWAAACGARSSCTFDDPIAAVDQMLAAAEDRVPSSGGRRTLGPGEALLGLTRPLYSERRWSALDEGVAAAIAGDGAAMVDLADGFRGLVDWDVYYAVNCVDTAWPDDPGTMLDLAKDAGVGAPRFGEGVVNDYLPCSLWPAPEIPIGSVTALGAPPIVVVSGTGDPSTPYENGVDVARRLESGVLVTYEGEGHTITFQGSPCIDRIVIDYLVDLVVPPDGDRC